MTRDEIYDHLARVYLGKKNKVAEKKRRQINAWLVINVLIAVIIFTSAFYGFTAFLVHRSDGLHNRVIYALNNGPIRLNYNLVNPYPPVKVFSLAVPQINAAKYQKFEFMIRGAEEGHPGIIRVEVKNRKNEISSVVIDGIKQDWRHFEVPFSQFPQITDWSNIEEVSFIIESWNARKSRGMILIDDICFSS